MNYTPTLATVVGKLTDEREGRVLFARDEMRVALNTIEEIGQMAINLLEALRPWEIHGQPVRSAAVRLTVKLASIPNFESEEK